MKKQPLFEVHRSDLMNKFKIIIAPTPAVALTRAETIWKKEGRKSPMEVKADITIRSKGSVDYIPTTKSPHWEFEIDPVKK